MSIPESPHSRNSTSIPKHPWTCSKTSTVELNDLFWSIMALSKIKIHTYLFQRVHQSSPWVQDLFPSVHGLFLFEWACSKESTDLFEGATDLFQSLQIYLKKQWICSKVSMDVFYWRAQWTCSEVSTDLCKCQQILSIQQSNEPVPKSSWIYSIQGSNGPATKWPWTFFIFVSVLFWECNGHVPESPWSYSRKRMTSGFNFFFIAFFVSRTQ